MAQGRAVMSRDGRYIENAGAIFYIPSIPGHNSTSMCYYALTINNLPLIIIHNANTVKINLIAIGNKMPDWVDVASNDYSKRLPATIKINSIFLPLIKRGKNPDIPRIIRDESRNLLSAVPRGSLLVVLDGLGKPVTTMKFSAMLDTWLQQGQDISIVIGGPDGVSDELLSQASLKISLSNLTFPHPLVRVILLEQIYRAWSILNNHPYHRT